MIDFELTIVGSNSSVPAYGRHQSCQFLQFKNQYILLDCGDGSQNRLIELKLKWLKIATVLISHLHGDHFFGLPGLLSSMGLSGRTAPLCIIGPIGLREMLLSVYKLTEAKVNYEITIIEIDKDDPIKVFDFGNYQVESVPLEHGIPAYGYKILEINRDLNLIPESIERFGLSIDQIKAAKKGILVYAAGGEVIPQCELTYPKKTARSYAYITDTSYYPSIVEQLQGVNLLYHDATFAGEMESYARMRGHSTAKQAAEIALKAKVDKLLIGHFSSRYFSLKQHLSEAREVFSNTFLAEEGNVFVVTH